MKRQLIALFILLGSIIYLASCKEQGDPFIHYRRTDSNTMKNIHDAYLRVKADSDSVLYTRLHYAEIKGHLFQISDSIDILYVGHCFSQETEYPTLINYETYTQLKATEVQIDTEYNELYFTSKIDDLEIDVNYYCRSYVIVQNKRTGVRDTGYNQAIKIFATKAQDIWFHRPDFNGDARTEATSFTMNNKAYILTGYGDLGLLKDMWRYNPADSSWTQMPNFQGSPRMSAVAFVIEDTVYVGTGIIDATHHITTGDFWKWTEQGNQYYNWRQIDSLGNNQERCNAVAFTINYDGTQRGYVGLGETTNEGYYRSDFYYYRPDLDTPGAASGRAWVQTQEFLGGKRTEAVSTVIGNIAIIGSGKATGGTLKNDFFVFDPTLSDNPWTGLVIKNDPPPARTNAVAFALNFDRNGEEYNYFYLGTGKNSNDSLLNDLWRYDFATKKWSRMSDMREDDDIADPREGAVSFTIYRDIVPYGVHTRGFIATGKTKNIYKRDVWEYLP